MMKAGRWVEGERVVARVRCCNRYDMGPLLAHTHTEFICICILFNSFNVFLFFQFIYMYLK